MKYFEVNLAVRISCKFSLNSRLGEKTLRENGSNMIGLSITGMGGGGLTGERERRRGRHAEIFALINDSSYMLKKIIKTHTTRLGVVDIIKPTFLRNAVATNRQRRVIASE